MSSSVAEFSWKSPGDCRGASSRARGALFSRQKSPQKQFYSQKNDLPASLVEESAFLSVSLLFKKALKFMPMHISTSELQTSCFPLTRWRSMQTSIFTRQMPCQSQCLHLLLLFGSSLRVSKILQWLKSMGLKLLFAVLPFTFTQNDINYDN